jgi:hypothetical protein
MVVRIQLQCHITSGCVISVSLSNFNIYLFWNFLNFLCMWCYSVSKCDIFQGVSCHTSYIWHTCHKYHCQVSLDLRCVICQGISIKSGRVWGEGGSKSDSLAFGWQLCYRPKATIKKWIIMPDWVNAHGKRGEIVGKRIEFGARFHIREL